MSDAPTTLQELEAALERMHDLLIEGGNWRERYLQEQLIHRLQERLAVQQAREQRDLALLTQIFS